MCIEHRIAYQRVTRITWDAGHSLRLRALVAVLFLTLACPAVAAQADPAKPNIVYILADDQGWGDARCYNPDSPLPTPGIDRMAREGMRFTDAHSASSVCTPTRYALLTGRYAWRTRLQKGVLSGGKDGDDPLIDEKTLTVGELLQRQGYDTAAIGKWHLGFKYALPEGQSIKPSKEFGGVNAVPVGTQVIGGPITRGFDRYWGFHHAREMACWIVDATVTENFHVQQMLPRITGQAEAYISERATTPGKPFFLYLSLSAPHTPIVPDKPWIGKSRLNTYGDFVMQVDDTVVRVLDALDKAGLARDTLVVFTADNGCSPAAKIDELVKRGHNPMAGLRGTKADIWEGGHRVPFIVRWPGVVEPGAVCDEPICQTSLLATCAELLGVKLADDQGVDSFSILPVLRGELINKPTHPTIVHHSFNGKFAIRVGGWKYIACKGSGGWSKGGDDQPEQLYDLTSDIAEQHNLAQEQPEVLARMRGLLDGVIKQGRSTPGAKQENDVPVSYP